MLILKFFFGILLAICLSSGNAQDSTDQIPNDATNSLSTSPLSSETTAIPITSPLSSGTTAIPITSPLSSETTTIPVTSKLSSEATTIPITSPSSNETTAKLNPSSSDTTNKTAVTQSKTTTKRLKARRKTTREPLQKIYNEFTVRENGFLELPCGYHSDINDTYIKWEKIDGGEMPKKIRRKKNKILLMFVKEEDTGLYQCTTAYDECYKFRVTLDDTSAVQNSATNPKKIKLKSNVAKPKIGLLSRKKDASVPAVNSKSEKVINNSDSDYEYYDDEGVPQINEITAQLGTNAEFLCGKSDEYDDYIEWEKLDNETLTESSYQLKNKLFIIDVQIDDAGFYQCKNVYDDIYKFELIVEAIELDTTTVVPEEAIEIEPKYARLDGMVELQCGDELPEYGEYSEWNKQDGELSVDSQVDRNSLIIFHVKDEDFGIYECTNVYGQRFKYELHLDSSEEEIEHDDIVELYAEMDATVELSCGTSSEFDSYIRWRKVDGLINENARREENNLIIPNVNDEDSGKYECIDINKQVFHFEIFLLDTTNPVTDDDDEQVTDDVNYVKEEETSYKKILAKPNSEIKLNCNVEPDREIQWVKKNGQLPVYNRKYGNILIIYYAKSEDSDFYECKQPDGKVIDTFEVKVHDSDNNNPVQETSSTVYPPNTPDNIDNELYIPYSANYGKLNSQIELVCGTSNSYDQNFEWIRLDGDRIIGANSRQTKNKLIFNQLTWDDQGDYQCKTPAGTYYRFRLYISEKNGNQNTIQQQGTTKSGKRPNEQQPTISNIDGKLGSIIELACGQPSTQNNYIEWRKLDGLINNNTDIKQNKLIIYDIKEEDAGLYECNTADRQFYQFRLSVLSNKPTSSGLNVKVEKNLVNLKKGQQLINTCTGSSSDESSTLDLQWYDPMGKLLSEQNENIKIESRLINYFPLTKETKLTISGIQQENNGNYECRLVTKSGSDSAYFKLAIEDNNNQLTDSETLVKNGFFTNCKFNQTICKNGQCIPRDNYCDGKTDCSDGSDEKDCDCQPNERSCRNDKCAPKFWFCDGEKDCEDGSDEDSCPLGDPFSLCKPEEFKCQQGNQCVSKSFLCDREFDCIDKSDELNCEIPKIKTPLVKYINICSGDQFEIHCEAQGFPAPFLSWRLNWGHTCLGEKRCSSFEDEGKSRLVISDARLSDAGAYSCEAMNILGTTFSVPETFVTIRDCSNQVPNSGSNSSLNNLSNKDENCKCNQHSTTCTCTGRCVGCRHNTKGKNCELCADGFFGDATKGTPTDCKPIPGKLVTPTTINPLMPLLPDPEDPNCKCNNHSFDCLCSGYCLACQHNTFGDRCQFCKKGFRGNPLNGTPNDCVPESETQSLL